MKFFKKAVLLGVISSLLPGFTITANASSPEAASVYYESISDIPAVLSDVSELRFKLNHPAYEKGGRNILLGQVLAEDINCLITFSIPEIDGLDNLDIEDYNFMAPKEMEKHILMMTAEYYEAEKGESIAYSNLFVFNPAEEPELTISFETGKVNAEMNPVVVETYLYSKNAKTNKIWADDYTGKATKTTVYQSSCAGMYNYAMHGWGSGGVDDVTFSYDYLDLPLDMRKCLTQYLYDYNEYLSKEAGKLSWYESMKTFWKDKEYSEFDLDAYAVSLGATVQNPPTNKGDKEYRIGDHIITIGCFTDPKDWGQLGGQDRTVSVGLDCSWVYWNEHGARTRSQTYNFETYAYEQRRDKEVSPVRIDDKHYVSRWDFDFIASLLEYCSKN